MDKDKSAQANACSRQIAKVIRWNVLGLYHHNGNRLNKTITYNLDILTKNKNRQAVFNGNAIPCSKFNKLFKSMVSNQKNLNQVGIDEFLCALRSHNVKKDECSFKPLKFKNDNVAPYSAH